MQRHVLCGRRRRQRFHVLQRDLGGQRAWMRGGYSSSRGASPPLPTSPDWRARRPTAGEGRGEEWALGGCCIGVFGSAMPRAKRSQTTVCAYGAAGWAAPPRGRAQRTGSPGGPVAPWDSFPRASGAPHPATPPCPHTMGRTADGARAEGGGTAGVEGRRRLPLPCRALPSAPPPAPSGVRSPSVRPNGARRRGCLVTPAWPGHNTRGRGGPRSRGGRRRAPPEWKRRCAAPAGARRRGRRRRRHQRPWA